jgi:hypothetical protein
VITSDAPEVVPPTGNALPCCAADGAGEVRSALVAVLVTAPGSDGTATAVLAITVEPAPVLGAGIVTVGLADGLGAVAVVARL